MTKEALDLAISAALEVERMEYRRVEEAWGIMHKFHYLPTGEDVAEFHELNDGTISASTSKWWHENIKINQ